MKRSMLMPILGVLLLAGCGETLTGCSGDVDSETASGKYPSGPSFSVEDHEMTNAFYDFAYRFMDASADIWANERKTNNMMSPLGASVTLAMLANGASPEVRSELLSALAIDEQDLSVYNSTMKKICKDFPHDVKGLVFLMANGMWLGKEWTMTPRYVSTLMNDYLTDITELGESTEQNADKINRWVNGKTKGMIPELIDSSERINFFVANALYLSAKWDDAFKETLHKDFYNYDGSTSVIEMMSGMQKVGSYYQTPDGDQLIGLHYSDNHISMNVFIPSESNAENLHDFSRCEGVFYAQMGMKPSSGETLLTMPKFSINVNNDLVPVLKSMGVNALFNSNSISEITDSSGECPDINIFRQRLRIDVDEKGCEVAAVTQSGMYTDNFPTVHVPQEITIDRPFLFLIYAYGLPVIAGQVVSFD